MPSPFAHDAKPRVLAEAPRYIAVYKPPRLHSSPLEGGGPDLCSWLFSLHPELGFDYPGRAPGEGGLFHRLDFETSGLVLFARDPGALGSLLASQDRGLVEKDYAAACSAGDPAAGLPGALPRRGLPLGPEPEAWESCLAGFAEGGETGCLVRLIGGLAAEGRPAAIECRFRPYGPGGARVACLDPGDGPKPGHRRGSPERVYRSELLGAAEWAPPPGTCPGLGEGRAALALELRIRRGFRHQIRAQLAWLGLPILGDPLYGGLPAQRLHLHAQRIAFPDPEDGRPISIESE
jgi:hypothetical protein